MIYHCVTFIVTVYLLGSIPFGKLIAKRAARINITQRGSGNIGATNVAREFGITWGLVTLFLDMLKVFYLYFSISIILCKRGKNGNGEVRQINQTNQGAVPTPRLSKSKPQYGLLDPFS